MTTEEFLLELTFSFNREDGDDRPFDEFLDCVLDELAEIGTDADYTASDADMKVTFSIPMEENDDSALLHALGDLRTALHAAQCATGGWEGFTHRFLEARSEVLADA